MDPALREQFIHAVMRFKRIDLCPHSMAGLQQSELTVMLRAAGCVCATKGAAVSDIHQNLYISKSALSQTLNSLEQKGLVVRTIDPLDRRKITVVLTSEGEEILAEAKQSYEKAIDDILDQFGAENIQAFLGLIDHWIKVLERSSM